MRDSGPVITPQSSVFAFLDRHETFLDGCIVGWLVAWLVMLVMVSV